MTPPRHLPFAALALLFAAHAPVVHAEDSKAPEVVMEEDEAPVVAGKQVIVKLPPEVLPASNPFTGQPEAIKEGKRLFGLYGCSGCHGGNGGGGMCPSFQDDLWTFGGDDQALYKLLRGQNQGQKMPNFASVISLDEVGKLLAFVRSVSISGYDGKGPPPILFDPAPKPGASAETLDGVALPAKVVIAKKDLKKKLERGKKLWNLYNCQTCHGPAGVGSAASVADDQWLFGSDDQTMFAVLRGGMARQKMPAYGSSMSLDEATMLIAYMRTLYKGDPTKVNW